MSTYDDQKLRSADIALVNFSDSLVPTEEFTSEGKKQIQKVFELLKRKSKFKVDRVFIGGSVGKQTDIMSPDFDCVLFINDETPLFEKVIQDFEEILTLDESLKIQNDIKTTKYSVQFTMPGGFTVDLLPAANLIRNQGNGFGGPALSEAQREAVLNRIRANPRNGLIYSSSLVEAQLEFMRTTDSFTHQLARLAKFWYKSLYFGEYISGAKTIIELLAVAAAENEQGREKSILRAFIKFLDYVSNIDTLKLAFVQKQDGKWHKSTCDIKFNYISPRGNYIIEPANPNNDMAESLGRTVLDKFKKFAPITKARFQTLMRSVTNIEGKPYLPFDYLFEPLPTVLKDAVHFTQPKFLCETSHNYRFLNPDMKIRNEGLLKKPEIREFLKAIQGYLLSIVNSVIRTKPRITPTAVKERVEQMINDSIIGTKTSWVPGFVEQHEDFDVTFTCPITTGLVTAERNSAIVLSVKW